MPYLHLVVEFARDEAGDARGVRAEYQINKLATRDEHPDGLRVVAVPFEGLDHVRLGCRQDQQVAPKLYLPVGSFELEKDMSTRIRKVSRGQ